VSVYLPTHRTGRELRQDPIRLKNLLTQAEEQLASRGVRGTEAKELLKPAWDLQNEETFRHFPSDGLAIFLSKGLFRHMHLPVQFEELVVVNSRFYLKPLLPVLSGDARYYVLSLAQKKVQFFEGTRYGIREVDVKTLPKSLVEALREEAPSEFDPQRQLYNRGGGRGSEQAALSGGHGAGKEEQKKHLLQFFRKVDAGLHEFLHDKQVPLVLAGVEYYLPIYKEANTYKYLVDQVLAGNHGLDNNGELHRQSWTVVEPVMNWPRQRAIAAYKEWSGTDKTTRDLGQIINQAYLGRIANLFLAPNRQRWGIFDTATGRIEERDRNDPAAVDLLDLAAVQTFLTAGNVYVVTDKDGILDAKTDAAATFRY
jgi:hypothetical protein